jgi:hypothetical protein
MMIPKLILVRESKICDLMPSSQLAQRWEASGVLAKDRNYFVVFDDRTKVARFSSDLQRDNTCLLGMAHGDFGYEGITYNPTQRRFYLLVEARKRAKGCYKPTVVEYDEEFKYLKERTVDFAFESGNKGFEAVVHVRRNSEDYLLALCEGNKCRGGDKGRKPGGGRLQLFQKKQKRWLHSGTTALPTSLPFVDYSGMSIDNGRVAVVSQVNSMLWVGQFDQAGLTWRNAGQLYEFPRSDDGSILYGNIEGVAWISSTRVVTVSDRRKKKSQSDKRLSEKDQSIHIFQIPH